MEVSVSHEHRGYLWLDWDQALDTITHDETRGVVRLAQQFVNLTGISDSQRREIVVIGLHLFNTVSHTASAGRFPRGTQGFLLVQHRADPTAHDKSQSESRFT